MSNQIILSKVGATDPIVDVVAPAGLKNGHLVVLGAQNADKTYASAANNEITDKSMALVMALPLSYGVEKTENDFEIATGDVVRAYLPVLGRVYSFPVENTKAVPTVAVAKGKVLVPDAGELAMDCKDNAGGTETVVFYVDEVFTKAGVSMVKARCIKSE